MPGSHFCHACNDVTLFDGLDCRQCSYRRDSIARVEARLRDIAAGAFADRESVESWERRVGELFDGLMLSDVMFARGCPKEFKLPGNWRLMTFRDLAAAIVDAQVKEGE